MTDTELLKNIAMRDRLENIAAVTAPTFMDATRLYEGRLFDPVPYTEYSADPRITDEFNNDPEVLLREGEASERLSGEFWHFILKDSVLVNGVAKAQEGNDNGDSSES